MLSPSLGAGVQSALFHYQEQSRAWAQAAERLATGLRINRAADDPAGLVAAVQLQRELVDLEARSRTLEAEDRRARIQESTLAAGQEVLYHLHDLVGAAAGSQSEQERELLQEEVDLALDAAARLESYGPGLGLERALAELRSGGSANVANGDLGAAGRSVEAAASMVARRRALLGAYQRTQLEPLARVTEDQIVLQTAALSQLADADYATESVRLLQTELLMKATLWALGRGARR
jgi:flagellin-like hook-associated protein FlgL